ncbi:hypothetical protein GCM10007036_14210 [Alsobacter metallidurans]|uniref:Uncharacterized protein n=2 Tax=Alsobacter metallidurans TaxID=340221 RepID=A0A917I6F5_9HYPH|nr:hypothetical protein GCM10007036_14210 [Alsobacter metallidurans]
MSGHPERFTFEQVADALRRAAGIQAGAAKLLGCNRSVVAGYMVRYPELREQAEELVEETLDVAELGLVKKLRDGNLTALIFYLKTKGKHRGYVERRETTGAVDAPPVQVSQVPFDPQLFARMTPEAQAVMEAEFERLLAAEEDA